MAKIRKEIEVEVQIGDIISTTNHFYRSDVTLYVCHIDGDLLYISDEENSPKNECETFFAEDCYLK
jgi:adenine-specific DNA methylase